MRLIGRLLGPPPPPLPALRRSPAPATRHETGHWPTDHGEFLEMERTIARLHQENQALREANAVLRQQCQSRGQSILNQRDDAA